MKFNSHTQKKAEALLQDLDFIIRYEKGNFNAGYCLLENKKVIVINKYFDTEAKVGALIEIIQKLSIKEEQLTFESRDFFNKIAQLKFEDF